MSVCYPQVPSIDITARDKVFFILILLVLFSTYPFVFNRIMPLPSIIIVMVFTYLAFFLFGALKKVTLLQPLISTAIVLSAGTIIIAIATLDIEYYKQLLYIWWGVIVVSFISKIGLKKFLFLYNRLILVIALLGVLSFGLFIILGDCTFLEFEEMDGRTGWLTYFTFTNANNGIFIRYAGIFDEPGAMATWGMFSLLFNKIYVKDQKIEFPLIIALLFTFSLAYILELSLYLFFFYYRNTLFATKFRLFVIMAVAIVAFFVYIDKDSQVYLLTFGRLGIGTSTDFLEDNNRANMMELAKKMFYDNPLFGVGTTRFFAGEYAADNPYETLAKDGIIGTLFLYFPLLKSLIFAKKDKTIFYMVCILALGYLQRPFHINIYHYTMLFLVYIVSYTLYKERQHNEIQYNYSNI